jgi:acid phosphatase (class A)
MTLRSRTSPCRAVLVVPLAVVLLAGGCRQVSTSPDERAATSGAQAAKAPGYLKPEERPDGVALLPAPPAPGSAAAEADAATYRRLFALESTVRWQLAAADANLKFPQAANTYGCALGIRVDPEGTPRLYTLLHRTIVDAGQSTSQAKLKYGRTRPFEETGDRTCVPEDEDTLRGSPSYPSGHASLGYVWGEVLALVVPERAAALRERAYQFGQSRVVCRVHHQSDVDAGRRVGEAVMPRLQQNAEFLADLAAARVEAQQTRIRAAGPGADCAAETRALSLTATSNALAP